MPACWLCVFVSFHLAGRGKRTRVPVRSRADARRRRRCPAPSACRSSRSTPTARPRSISGAQGRAVRPVSAGISITHRCRPDRSRRSARRSGKAATKSAGRAGAGHELETQRRRDRASRRHDVALSLDDELMPPALKPWSRASSRTACGWHRCHPRRRRLAIASNSARSCASFAGSFSSEATTFARGPMVFSCATRKCASSAPAPSVCRASN